MGLGGPEMGRGDVQTRYLPQNFAKSDFSTQIPKKIIESQFFP